MWGSIALIVFAAATTCAAATFTPTRCAPTLGILANLTLLGVTDHNVGFSWDLATARSSPSHEVQFSLELHDSAGNIRRIRFRSASNHSVCTLDGLLPNAWYIFRVQAIHIKGGRCRVSSNIGRTSFKTLKLGTGLFSSWNAPLLTEKIHQRHRREAQLLFFAEKQDNEIVLDHDFRISSTGVLNYYELLVSEKDAKVDMLELLYIPRLIGDIYKITPEGTELSSRADSRAEFAEGLRQALFGDWRPSTPLEIVIIKLTQTSIRLAIVFAPPRITTDELEDFVEHWEAPRLRLKSGLADLLNFARFEEVLFRIRRCVSYSWRAFDSCGHASDFVLLSNVGRPSRVRYPELFLAGDILRVSWKKPEPANGPLDGYVLSIQTSPKDTEDESEAEVVHIKPIETYYEIPKYRRELAYNIGIAAFNFDLENETLEHTGDWVFMLPPDTWRFHYEYFLIIMFAIIFTLAIVVGITCLCVEVISHYWRNRGEIPPLAHQE